MTTVIILPEARRELRDARRWYAEHAGPSISARFLGEFHRLRTIVAEEPKRGPEIEPGIHRVLFRDRFPYSLLYVIRQSDIVIVAVMHQHREPGYWRSRFEAP